MSPRLPALKCLVAGEYSVLSSGPTIPTLTDSEIHVWQKHLHCHSDELERYRSLLSPDESKRAARFRFASDRNELIVARGTLRVVLGRYLSRPPDALQFVYSEFGKPALAANAEQGTIEFNISHSGGIALLAFARGRRIGIDIEQVRCDFSTLEIAHRFFSQAERDELQALPSEQRSQAFFDCWTRKEAFIKALGEGLSHPLDSFDVSVEPGEPAQLLATRPDGDDAARWGMWDISVPSGYTAALAAALK
jgi:4'-phosphopantetheinyl transferase